ncbi:Tudor domain-containing protein 6 [Takifugu flavidus]|uniref:Tudor domain-containing protein 6 n=2 Tax=Takifugu flavidus TaxID=433684 RepID=A0A5C6P104_9TELE|nr:Tudor domain-containing protein 6 [Takifugu flavidus]
MREDIQHPERNFNGAEGRPGNFCLVCISDIWHRARIESIERENYSVFLIDQAQAHVTTGRSLAWAKSDSFVLPPEIESCILANVLITENELERAETFLKLLPGKTFEALVQAVLMRDRIIILDVPAVSQEMCEAGLAKKIPEDEFENLVQKGQENHIKSSRQPQKHSQYLYPALLTNTYEHVYVAEVIDPQNIFCRLLIFSSALKLLSEEIQHHYEEQPEFAEAQSLACGDPCAAKGSDGRWNRSVLKQDTAAAAGLVEVMHVDEGKTELVPVDNVKPLHEKFLRMPVVTYPCHLDGVKESGTGWTKDQTDYLKSLILNQTALAMFSHHITPEDVYRVILYASDAVCVNSCFLSSSGSDPNAFDEPILPFLHSNTQVSMKVQETTTNTKTLVANDRKGAAGSDNLDDCSIKSGSDSLLHRNHHSAVFPSDETATSDGTFAVGSNVSVKVTCIESLHKFWCQKTEKFSSVRRLMQNLQSHYAFTHPQPIVESICVARSPDDGMWYRSRIMASPHSPVVAVRFIDFGHVQKVPLRDVRPIDPAFLRLNAQAFQCCLFSERGPSDPTAVNAAESALADFQKLEDRGSSPDAGLRCVVKAVTSDEEGLPLNVVEFEAPSEGAGKLVALKGGNQVQITPSNGYSCSAHSIKVGGKEKVSVTSCNNVNHFYCNLEKSSPLLSKLHKNIQQFVARDLCRQRPVGPDSICIAKHPDNQWYRGRVVENSPQIKVHFVDHGDTLVVNEWDICAFPNEAAFAKSVPVQAILLGLFGVPEEVPQEVNRWFALRAINHTFTISVVAKGGNGKLIVELFDGSVNVNVAVREMMKRTERQTTATPEQQQPTGSSPSKSNQSSLPQEGGEVCSNGECVGGRSNGEISDVFVQEDEMNFEAEHKQTVDIILGKGRSLVEPAVKQMSFQTCSEGSVDICAYKRPDVPPEQTQEVFASCIVGPLYFWCQYAATEELETISTLAQEVGQSQGDLSFSTSLNPGSPCLALFSDDNQWYRAQVLRRHDNELHLVFIDYGNEADVEVKYARPLPRALLERPPQAFLCSLDGFEESQGSWDDGVYDVFFNLLVDKLLRVTVNGLLLRRCRRRLLNVQDNQETAIPQYSVQVQFEKTNVNDAMKKYWTPAAKKHVVQEDSVTENVLQYSQTGSTGNENTHTSENRNRSDTKMEVFASCIVEPFFFWCQYANTGDLDEISRLAQEAGQSQLDTKFPKTLVPGSLCLALFSSNNQWYRARVMDRQDNCFHVVFIDYGNKADVDVKNVRSVPGGLLDMAPQAFLCSLGGFDESKGSWDNGVYSDFYNLLVNKPLKLSVLKIGKHSESALPQHQVEIECEGVDINKMMKKYWKPLSKQSIPVENTDTLTQDAQTDSSQSHAGDSKEKTNAVRYKQPTFSRDKKENVYASCIVGPCFFWCQYADTENLVQISQLCQEAGQTQPNTSNEAAAPGGPCLALFSSDSQWYRAQVMARRDATVHVVFVDYGNEADVAVECVRQLPPGLLATAPQAFLCCMNGFDKSDSSWHDEVCEDFYSLLVDKPLRVTVLSTKAHPEIEVPQYMVQVEFKDVMIGGWLDVNTLMDRRARQKGCLAAKVQLG